MPRAKFKTFDAASYLTSEEVIAAYLEAAAEGDDPDHFARALEDVARARRAIASQRKLVLPKDSRRS